MSKIEPTPAPDRQSPHERETGLPTGNPASSTRWQQIRFILRAVEVRLRFIGLFVGIGLLMAYWTTIESYWDRWTRPAGIAVADSDSEYYCPMHPSVIRPGLEANGAVPNCPICGMPLSYRKKGEAAALPDGVLTRVQLSPERVRLAGVMTAPISYMPLNEEVRTVGYVQYDESRLAEIVTRVGGYLEQLFVNKTFEQVQAGQPLAEVYSPDLYSSIQELRLARKHGSTDLMAAARQRLKLLGIDDTGIDEALAGGDTSRIVIRSPQAGQVIQKNVVEGASVSAGTVLFQVADLATVWIEADVYERDLSFVHEGQAIEATFEALPGETFPGRIELLSPQLNTETRTNRIRVSIDNPKLVLRPGMFATVRASTPISETEPFKSQIARRQQQPSDGADEATLVAYQQACPVTGKPLGSMGDPVKTQAGDRAVYLCCAGCEDAFQQNVAGYLSKLAAPPADAVLSVPERAVIDTGERSIVYVEREPGMFEGVEVQLGSRSGSHYPVISGLTVGDRVVAAGSFLLDAETRLNPAAAAAYFGAGGASSDRGAAGGNEAPQKDSSAQAAPGILPAHREKIDLLAIQDRPLALAQAICPVSDEPLGSMGVPIKVATPGGPVFVCCRGCTAEVEEHPDKYLEKVRQSQSKADRQPETRDSTGAAHQH